MSDQQALNYLARFMLDKSLSFEDLSGLLALKPQTTVQDFVRNVNKFGVRIYDAQALSSRKDIFPRWDTLNLCKLDSKLQQHQLQIKEKELIANTYFKMFQDPTGQQLDEQSTKSVMLEMFTNGTVRGIKERL